MMQAVLTRWNKLYEMFGKNFDLDYRFENTKWNEESGVVLKTLLVVYIGNCFCLNCAPVHLYVIFIHVYI
jgi:hypothetical protein